MAFLDYPGLQHFKATENGQVAPVESTTTASQAYEIGEYFWCEGNFCKAKIPIASGATLVQNTNYTVIKVGDEIEKKANTDGYYEAMTVGNAEQIVATEGAEDNAPYVFRKSGGGLAIGNREADTLVGGTIAWNQLVQNGNFADSTKWGGTNSTRSVANNVMSFTPSAQYGNVYQNLENKPLRVGHKYFLSIDVKAESNRTVEIGIGDNVTFTTPKAIVATTSWQKFERMYSVSTISFNSNHSFFARDAGTSGYVQVDLRNATFFDITKMFGETIADYIYGLETANVGAGVAWFRNLFPKPYYAYNAGTLMSVNVASHDMVGFNQWDEQWELGGIDSNGNNAAATTTIRSKNYIRVIPNETYYVKSSAGLWLWGYNANKNYIGRVPDENRVINNTFTVPNNVCYVRFVDPSSPTYMGGICINISSYRNSEYEPYELNTYPLDSEIQLRGMPKLDANNNLYYDGDIYEADGTVTRKYDIIDLGTLDWYDDGAEVGQFRVNHFDTALNKGNCITTDWLCYKGGNYTMGDLNKVVGLTNGQSNCILRIRDNAYANYTTTNFKTAMSGKYLVYELYNPTEETAEPYAANQVVSGYGTEEYVDAGVQASTRDVSIPVGHNTIYQQNLRDKLQDAPDSPSEDGDYVMRRANGNNAYVARNLADVNGNYPDMIVGNAKQIVSTIGIEDKIPYNFRTSGGSVDIGDRETDMVVGGTIAWNQLVPNSAIDKSGSLVNHSLYYATITSITGLILNHVYYIGYVDGSITNTELQAVFYLQIGMASAVSKGIIKKYVSGTSAFIGIGSTDTSTPLGSLTYEYSGFQLFDLTLMFGEAVANQILAVETTTEGAGVSFLKSLFPKTNYAYNAGTLMSVNTSSHIMTGFNQWDEQWENGYITDSGINYGSDDAYLRSKNYIHVAPSTVYNMTAPANGKIQFYDYNKDFISFVPISPLAYGYQIFDVPSNAHYMRFWLWKTNHGFATYDNNICINISWDGERDGEYEPYVEYNYPLDSSLELRGLPKLDSSNNLYYDGDTYESDGKVTRRYGVVDMGTLNWQYNGVQGQYDRFSAQLSDMISTTDYQNEVLKCSKYYMFSPAPVGSKNINKTIDHYNGSIYVLDSAYNDATTFKTAMSGVYLVYELKETTTEEASPYQNPQIVDDFGTEEYVDFAESQGTRDVSVPVGHETVYAPNLRAKLETAPDSPPADGDYIVRQTNGENAYVQLVIPQELPDVPEENGTYNLQVSVSSGTATLSWVSAT